MDKTTTEIKWDTKAGEVIVTINHATLDITASVDDDEQFGATLEMIKHPQAVAKIGKIGIVQGNLDRINAALAIAAASPERAAYLAKEAQIDAAIKSQQIIERTA